MKRAPLPYVKNRVADVEDIEIKIENFRHWAQNWVFDAKYRQFSESTINKHTYVHEKMLWFAEYRQVEYINVNVIRDFLAYLSNPKRRWGNRKHPACQRPASRSTVDTYYGVLSAFFNWCIQQGYITQSPLQLLKRPLKSKRKIAPFDDDELRALIKQTKKSKYPLRDNAILHFLLGTGLRASELCSLRYRDIEIKKRRVRVIGKGDKERIVSFGSKTQRLLFNYIKTRGQVHQHQYVFINEKGHPFTRSGLRQIFVRLGERAGLERERISPHTMRHTFAVNYLMSGGNVFALKELLGHESLYMTNRYVEFAEAYLETQLKRHAPDDRLYR